MPEGSPIMSCVNCDQFPTDYPTARVRQDRCDGCALCVEVCPKNCLTIVDNPARPGKRIVVVGVKACSGCGACQGMCPKEAIVIPGLAPEDLRRFVDQALEQCDIHP